MAAFPKEGSRIAVIKLLTLPRRFQRRALKVFANLASVRFLVPGLLAMAVVFLQASEGSVKVLRKQLQTAEEASDNPAIVEISRRIVEMDPNDSEAWETLANKQLELEDLERCAATLDAWQTRVRPRPAVIDDIRGDLALARKDNRAAEHYWRLYIGADPEATDTLEKLAKLSESAGDWAEAASWRTRALAQGKTVAGLIARANDYLELRAWEKSFADVTKANNIDPSDAAVKGALPGFELLRKFLPQIKALDTQIAKSPAAPLPWMDRARLFTLANRPRLALEDAEHAMKLAPEMRRARIQAGEALWDLGRGNEAADLGVGNNLKRDKNNHVSDEALRAIGAADSLVLNNPGQSEPFVVRANALRQINQNKLALTDAEFALKLDPDSTSAQLQTAQALDSLGRLHEAITHAERATQLNPDDPVSWYYCGLLEAKRANFAAAIECQSRSLAIRKSSGALLEREKCERQIGRIADAELDAERRKQLPTPQE
jgi:tetratricopeptide (TPR) repeat protein